MNKITLTDRDWEVLSSYLDGQVSPKEKARIETRLQEDASFRSALSELETTKRVFRMLPKVHAPRNFTLTPEMAGMKKPSSPLFSVLRFVSVMASILFVMITLGDFFAVRPMSSTRESLPLMAPNVVDQSAGEIAREKSAAPLSMAGNEANEEIASESADLETAGNPQKETPSAYGDSGLRTAHEEENEKAMLPQTMAEEPLSLTLGSRALTGTMPFTGSGTLTMTLGEAEDISQTEAIIVMAAPTDTLTEPMLSATSAEIVNLTQTPTEYLPRQSAPEKRVGFGWLQVAEIGLLIVALLSGLAAVWFSRRR